MNAKVGLFVQGTKGKILRLLTTTLVGIPNPLVGFIASTLDQFICDRFFRRSGVAAFVNELYPSIFKNK